MDRSFAQKILLDFVFGQFKVKTDSQVSFVSLNLLKG